MKVSKVLQEFSPITIVLETEDEAKVMYYQLNFYPLSKEQIETNQSMVVIFDSIYCPEEFKKVKEERKHDI